MTKKFSIKVWMSFEDEPGVEYEESEGYVAVRVWEEAGYKQAGPIRLLGSTKATVRHLLEQMRAQES